jgi:hypothetical protein
MTKAESELSKVYLEAFTDRNEWTQEDHLNGLKAVFVAGASAQARLEQATTERKIR